MTEPENSASTKPIGLWLTVILSLLITAESAPKLAETFGYIIGPLVAFGAGALLFSIGFVLGKLGGTARK